MAKKLHDYTKEELIELVQSLKKAKKFGLVWEDKPEQVAIDCQTKLPVLQEVADRAITKADDQPTNLIIEGDNYHSLSTLNYTHAGKIDVIYIDPPYNTGNKDFIYNDHYVDKEDAFKHSKWLSFMSKRLKLAKQLLTDTGLVFISIDDSEQAHLKLLCDDIFGEVNFVGTAPRKTGAGSAATRSLSELRKLNDYVLIYRKSPQSTFKRKIVGQKEYPFEDEYGKYLLGQFQASGSDATRKARPNMWYPIYVLPSGSLTVIEPKKYTKQILPKEVNGEEGRWLWNKAKFEADNAKLIHFDGEKISRKIYYDPKKDQNIYQVEKAWLEGFMNAKGTTELNEILGKKGVFNNPKPTEMMRHLVNLHPNKDAIVLDFFAGSGTTGQAVVSLNITDDGKRQFILCTNNENNIADNATYQRITKVINGYGDIEGIPANVRYFKTDFVDKASNTDQTRVALVARATDMIKIRENTFEAVTEKPLYKVYASADTYSAIIFDPSVIDQAKAELAKLPLDKPIYAYVFSLANDSFDSDFADMDHTMHLCPIPESILEVYKRIFTEGGKK